MGEICKKSIFLVQNVQLVRVILCFLPLYFSKKYSKIIIMNKMMARKGLLGGK